jgi:lethal(2) giant larvae protein
MAFEPSHSLLYIGTSTGELRVYGQPGVEFCSQTKNQAAISSIFTFRGNHQLITVDTSNTVIMWELVGEGSSPSLEQKESFFLDPDGGKVITAGCLAQLSGHFYIGTEGGNVFVLDLRKFQLESDIIYWNTATAIIQPTAKNHLGHVKCLSLCPTDRNQLLIGYEKGVISLWDLDKEVAFRNFPNTVQECQQVEPLESVSWQYEGQKFVSAHSDSSIYYWSMANTSANEGPTQYYAGGPGENSCSKISKISWLNTDANPLLIFTGGLPADDEDEHHTVTVIQGADHIALDFTSPVVDYVTVIDESTQRGKALMVLCEQELLGFDLQAPKCPQIHKPYLFSLHSSPVTCLRLFEGCSSEFFQSLHEVRLTSPPPREHVSDMPWPALGGYVRQAEPTSFDLFVTGHENGSVKFWDVTPGAMRLIYELPTANLFVGQEPEQVMDDFSDFKWPPYKKVSEYDTFEDDSRLAVRFIELCPFSRTLCVGGGGGQVLTFSLNLLAADIRLECAKAEIFMGQESSQRVTGLRNTSPLVSKPDLIPLPAGFQASFNLQLMPATNVTAMAFEPSWGLVAASNNKGFVVANFLMKHIVVIHPTVTSDGIQSRSIGRMQSFRRSMRRSFRGRSRTTSSASLPAPGTDGNNDRRKIAQSLNREAGMKEKGGQGGRRERGGGRQRIHSEPTQSRFEQSPPPSAPDQVPPEMMGVVTHLTFADTFVSGRGPAACVFASTMGSVVIRYSITLPHPDSRLVDINRATPIGKDYTLLHAAPVVAVFILDRSGVPVPCPYEVENKVVPAPDMHSPHFALICTQEQLKLVALPSMRQKKKEKLSELMQERILKAWLVRIKVAAAPVGAPRDWNPAVAILTSGGNLMAYSLPDLRTCFNYNELVAPTDHRAIKSTAMSVNGEVFYLRSFSELERSLISSYGFSYHTTMLPNIFPFEGSTGPVQSFSPPPPQQPPSAPVTVEVTMEGGKEGEGEDDRSRRSQTPSPEDPLPKQRSPEKKKKKRGSKSKRRSKESKESKEPSVPPVDRSSEPRVNHEAGEGVVNGIVSGPEKEGADMTDDDKAIIASATAFKELQKQRHGSSSGDSSSSESSSSSSDEDDDIPMPSLAAVPGANPVAFENPYAMDLMGGKELDNIIATSLKQLESARDFYEKMQAKVKKTE